MARRSAACVALAIAVVAGCAGPSQTTEPSIVAPSTPSTTPAPTLEPTADPVETPAPSTAVGCPSDLPTSLASVEELADPHCYGSTELTIEGWLAESGVWTEPGETEPGWTNPFVELYAQSPRTGAFVIDFLQADANPGGVAVVTQPRTGIDLSGNGRAVTLRGHFNDPEASACTKVRKDSSDPDCAGLFVVTGLEGRPSDSPVCPSDSPIDLDTFLSSDARCFRGHEVQIRGWEDVGEGFGGTGPIWRVDESSSMRMAEAQLATDRFEDYDVQPYLFVWIAKGSGIRFEASDRRVVVTAQLGHPAAKDCVPEAYEGWSWTPPITWAQHYCERMLVITDVRAVD